MLALVLLSGLMLAGYVEGAGIVDTAAIAAQVQPALKASWCNSQQSACSKLCNSKVTANTCTVTTLAHSCVCSDGTTSDLASYRGTIDYYTCSQSYSNCIVAHSNDQAAQTKCRTDYVCGAKDPSLSYSEPSAATLQVSISSATSVAAVAQSTSTVAATVTTPAAEAQTPPSMTEIFTSYAPTPVLTLTVTSTSSASITPDIPSTFRLGLLESVATSAASQISVDSLSVTQGIAATTLTMGTLASATSTPALASATGGASQLCKVGLGVPAAAIAVGLLAL